MHDALKAFLKTVLSRRAYGWLTAKYAWGRTLVNYWLMRVPGLRVGAWPHALYIEGTNICNAECVFCAYPQMERPKKVMDMGLFNSVVDQYAALGGREVDVTPIVGDPFVDGKLFERLDHLAGLSGLRRFHFYTNAIGMRPELGRRLLGYGARLKIYISFGGFDRDTYRRIFCVDKFDVVTANIKALVEAKRESGSALGIQLNLRTPKDNHNGEFWDYLQEAARQGLLEIEWMHAYDSWSGRIKEEDLNKAGLKARPMPPKKGPCHRLLTSPVVLADGRVNACACRDVEASLIVGDLKKESLAGVLKGKALRELVDSHARGDFPEVCRRCTYYDPVYPYWWVGGGEED